MKGRRVRWRPGFPGRVGKPGDYVKVPAGMDPRAREGVWYCLDPTGGAGAILPDVHQVVEHDDESITVSPSLVMPSGWHGFLRAGVWTSV